MARGENVLGGQKLKRFFLGALKSMHFNRVLERCFFECLFDQVVVGDWARKHNTGDTFLVDNIEMNDCAKKLEISGPLPLYGRKVHISKGQESLVE